MKGSLDGTHHRVSEEHLDRYLAQLDFRYTFCKETDSERMCRVIGNVKGRRLPSSHWWAHRRNRPGRDTADDVTASLHSGCGPRTRESNEYPDRRRLADKDPVDGLRRILAISPEDAEQVREDAAEKAKQSKGDR